MQILLKVSKTGGIPAKTDTIVFRVQNWTQRSEFADLSEINRAYT
jgi:hypothetical protein